MQLAQLLRLSALWGPHSFAVPDQVSQWTGGGWMCRVYLTVALGVAAPLAAFFALGLLSSAVKRRRAAAAAADDGAAVGHPGCSAARLLGRALLYSTPVAAVQGAVAWVSLAITYHGSTLEDEPRSVLAYFFAVYWRGSPQQCAGAGAAPPPPGAPAPTCTLCVFPAAAAVAHLAWTLPFLCALWAAAGRAAAAALNRGLKRRLRLFVGAWTALGGLGCAAMGVSVAWGPFTWANQACWIAYFASVAATSVLLSVEAVARPARDLRAAGTVRARRRGGPAACLCHCDVALGGGVLQYLQYSASAAPVRAIPRRGVCLSVPRAGVPRLGAALGSHPGARRGRRQERAQHRGRRNRSHRLRARLPRGGAVCRAAPPRRRRRRRRRCAPRRPAAALQRWARAGGVGLRRGRRRDAGDHRGAAPLERRQLWRRQRAPPPRERRRRRPLGAAAAAAPGRLPPLRLSPSGPPPAAVLVRRQ
jgi:hypothetical protein